MDGHIYLFWPLLLAILAPPPVVTLISRRPSHSRNTVSAPATPTLTCRNQHGQPLDWFIAYKLAKIEASANANVRAGLGYAFLAPSSSSPSSPEWELAPDSMNDSASLLGATFAPLFSPKDPRPLLHLAWNDQPPDAPPIPNNAHSKGVLLADAEGGVWVEHSVPHFPAPAAPNYAFPHTGTHNGQLLLCTTLTPAHLDSTLPALLAIIKPHIYSHSFPPQLRSLYPNLYKIVTKATAKKSQEGSTTTNGKVRKVSKNDSKIFNLLLPGLNNVTIFAKSPSFKTEIYGDWIGPWLGQSLDVQSWLNGAHPLPSNCTRRPLNVLNILSKRLGSDAFSTHTDHSKWAVTQQATPPLPPPTTPTTTLTPSTSPSPWLCIADLNRMDHQKDRGGIAICIPGAPLAASFQQAILSLEPCAKPIH